MNDELLNTKEICDILHKNRAKIQQYREAGLLRMTRMGRGFVTTRSELNRFTEMCIEYGLDLSNPEKIILAGQKMRQLGRAYRNHTVI